MKLIDEYNENVRIVNPWYKMSKKITINYGISTSFLTGPISYPLLSTLRRPMEMVL